MDATLAGDLKMYKDLVSDKQRYSLEGRRRHIERMRCAWRVMKPHVRALGARSIIAPQRATGSTNC